MCITKSDFSNRFLAVVNGSGDEISSVKNFFSLANLKEIYLFLMSGLDENKMDSIDCVDSFVRSSLSEKRYLHTTGCKCLAVVLASLNNENVADAAVSALLHDITKEKSLEEDLLLCNRYDIICDSFEKASTNLLHSKTAAYYSKELFRIDDNIFDSILYHTTGRAGMSCLEKIIFLSDSIEPTRTYEGVNEIRRLSLKSLNTAVAVQLKMNLDNLNARSIVPHSSSIEAFDYYKEFLPNDRQ